MQYAEKNPLMTESAYPYEAYDGTCEYEKSQGKVKVTDITDVTESSMNSLVAAVAKGPVSVAIEADQYVFQSYAGGVLKSSRCGTNLDHGVLVVGYDQTASTPYWIVKNSWGGDWGESGYIRIAMVSGDGICGVQMQPVQPSTN